MQFLNALSPLQWAAAAAIPIGVIALYFLKLKRQPLQVPSTFLWQKSVEDLHVNSLFQRLRKNLLLFLQLLILALALLALLRPAWFAHQSGGQRHVILIDNSASMSATDVEPNRLEDAKRQAVREVIDEMEGDDIAMVIAFNDSANVVQSYTSNRQLLRERIKSIEPTQRTTNLREALEVASGLANPQSFSEGARSQQAQVEDSGRPQLHLFTDGGFADVKDFSLGSLSLAEPASRSAEGGGEPDKEKAYFNVVGKESNNVAIVAMMVRRNEEHAEQLQVFARLYNFGAEAFNCNSQLFLDGELKDAREVTISGKTDHPVAFDLENLEEGVLELRLDVKDTLASDNVARCVVGNIRRGKVLLVTRGNRWLELAMKTEAVRQVSEVELMPPSDLESEDFKQKAASGHYDLIVFDSCSPSSMPQCNTLFFGAMPLGLGEPRVLSGPVVAEVNDTHPLFRFLTMDNVGIVESLLPELPSGTEWLLESGDGPLAFLLTREGFWDCVIGFSLKRPNEDDKWNTDWFLQRSFPMFVFNAVRVLGNVQDAITDETILPGQTVVLRSESLADAMEVKSPGGAVLKLDRSPQGNFLFNQTDQIGVYQFGDGDRVERRFAVNLFDMRESNIEPRSELTIGHIQVAAKRELGRARQEAWRWLVLAAFAVLLAEWYIYNRRVYI
jgi:hypothetical protein